MNKKIIITPVEKNSEHFLNIVPATEFVPEWYRQSPTTLRGTNTEINMQTKVATNSTYKKCTPVLDALTHGDMVFLTADVEVTRKADGMPYLMWRTNREIISEHSNDQWAGFPCPEGYSPYVYKWHNQFNIQTPKDYSLLFLNPINRMDLPFTTVTGIVDCDLYGGQVHFPFFIKDDFVGIIEKGTPIAQIIPIKREPWQREHKSYDENKSILHAEKYLSIIKRSYKKQFWSRKEYK